jgi:phosphatidylglycerophosphate synthase
MSPKPGFEQFWSSRGDGYETAVNRWATSHAAALVAYTGARLGLTPNQVTLLSLVCGVVGFLLAFALPVDRPEISIAVIVIFAELAFILDCADGLLARVTDTATPYGKFIDHTLDIASQSCALGAIFVYAYRAGLSLQNPELANGALVVGFVFLLARATRHTAIHLSDSLFGRPMQPSKGKTLNSLLTNLLEYQASMIAVVAYLVSPLACLAMFGAQTLLCAAAVTRRLVRAINLEQT